MRVSVPVTATNSRETFFDASCLGPCMHLSCMQRDEPMDAYFKKADISVFHTRMSARSSRRSRN